MNSSEKKVSILDRLESFGEKIGLIQKVTPLVEGDELRNLKEKGELVWPVPLTLDHSHVFAHCIELQFEDEEDADQFFSMYSDAMGNIAVVRACDSVLSAEDMVDLEQARRDLQCLNLSTASIDAILDRQRAGFERCFEALGIAEDKELERSWPSLALEINRALATSGQRLTDEQIFEVLRSIDPDTKRLPPVFKAFAHAIVAATENQPCSK